MATNLPAGEYTVTVTDANNCTQIETIIVDQTTNTENLNESFHLIVSPNPNSGIFTVDLEFQNLVNWELKVTNSLGQLMQQKIAPGNGTATSKLDFDLPRGVYWVSLFVNRKVIGNEVVFVE